VNQETKTLRELILDKFREVDRSFDTVIDNFEHLADKQVEYFYQADHIRLEQEDLSRKLSEIIWRIDALERHAKLANFIVRQIIFLMAVGGVSWLVFYLANGG